MQNKGQGSIEYLLIIGAAVIVAVLVITLMMSLSGTGTQNVEDSGVDSAYEGLFGIKDKYKGVMRVSLSFKAGQNELVVPQFYASNMLEDVFDSEQTPLGTTIEINGESYILEEDGWKETGQVPLEKDSIIIVTTPIDFDLEVELVPGQDVVSNPDPIQRISLISPESQNITLSEYDEFEGFPFEFEIDNSIDPIIEWCQLNVNMNRDVGFVVGGKVKFENTFYYTYIWGTTEYPWDLNCYDGVGNRIDSTSGIVIVNQANYDFLSGDGTLSDPYLIDSCEQLKHVNNYLSSHFKLNNDIDCSQVDFIPLGNLANPFKGSFNGNGKTISNLSINSELNYVGLFGYVDSTHNLTIYNLTLDSVNVTKSTNNPTALGGLVGYSKNLHRVENVSVSGLITGATNTGGIIGEAKQTTLENVSFSGIVNGAQNVGGIIGNSSNVTSTGLVTTSETKIIGEQYVGGLIGMADQTTIYKSKSLAAVNATMSGADPNTGGSLGRAMGGLVGYISGNTSSWIKESFVLQESQMDIINGDGLIGNNTFIGGLVGSLQNGVVVENCFVRIAISPAEGTVGGLIGYNNGVVKHSYSASLIQGTPSIKNGFFGDSQNSQNHEKSFFDSTLANTYLVGENNVPIYPKSTIEMFEIDNYSGWDSDKWAICGGQYPELKWDGGSCN